MTPHIDDFNKEESGIRRVIEAYFRYLPDYGIELVKPNEAYDLRAVHAGMTGRDTDIAHLHGLYWTADYNSEPWQYGANAHIVYALRNSIGTTVPSEWVAETIQRDMRYRPDVINHGIEISEWEPREHQHYVLWNKNRRADVCDPTPMMELANMNKNVEFVTTFLPLGFRQRLPNVRGMGGVQKHTVMKRYILEAGVYLSTTKETFGIGILEAMAAGIPILGFDWGGNQDLVKHGINGYLARPNNIKDLSEGLAYCIKHRSTLGDNSREMAKKWDWPQQVAKVANVYNRAMQSHPYEGTVSVVIPCYNYAHSLERTVQSVLKQTLQPLEIIIVDDGSTDETPTVGLALATKYETVKYVHKENGGVATARNRGIEEARGEFICSIDADDAIEPAFLEACVIELRKDRTLGIAYTGLKWIKPDGSEGIGNWPGEFNADKHLSYRSEGNARGANQIPTCCVFRRLAWERTGGYKQRYAPLGAGAEDAEFFARIMSIGFNARKVSDGALFIYSHESGRVSKPFADGSISKDLLEPQWLSMHPWAKDKQHPFASVATPENNLISHPVRQYDGPEVSIIIPVGKGHEKDVENALDSLESQTFRKWEAIVVWDGRVGKNISVGEGESGRLLAYPYVREYNTGSFGGGPSRNPYGAGYARNRGAEIARAPFLVFLDADDSLTPTFLEQTLAAWKENQAVVYTDYVSKFYTTEEDLKNFDQDKILRFLPHNGEVIMRGNSAKYDCERAQRQPTDRDLFHWCLVTTLVPKVWHDEIGGFDESMESFEDVLYHWALARRGHCYTHIAEPLVVYRMYTGTRRERASLHTEKGLAVAKNMLQYAKEVLERTEIMGCKKCPGSKASPTPAINFGKALESALNAEEAKMLDTDYIMVDYINPNTGKHRVVGAATGIDYRWRNGGGKEQFLVHRDDIAAHPHYFRPVAQTSNPVLPDREAMSSPQALGNGGNLLNSQPPSPPLTEPVLEKQIISDSIAVGPAIESDIIEPVDGSMPAPGSGESQSLLPVDSPEPITSDLHLVASELAIPPEIAPVAQEEEGKVITEVATMDDETVDLSVLPGISTNIANELTQRGFNTKQKILDLGAEGLQQIPGIGATKAEMIVQFLEMDKNALAK